MGICVYYDTQYRENLKSIRDQIQVLTTMH